MCDLTSCHDVFITFLLTVDEQCKKKGNSRPPSPPRQPITTQPTTATTTKPTTSTTTTPTKPTGNSYYK